jgi:3-phenylpropionate/trans-cinnamate dioxygenase alpha subunit
MVANLDSMIGERASWVRREAFVDQELFDREQERVFQKNWLFLGHESQIANPRDFITCYMGIEPVIVTRDSSGTVRAFLNTCRHRGMRVCRADKGNTPAFTCSYHGWCYDTTGALIGVPQLQYGYFGELDKSEWGLLPVAKVDTYKGLIFGTFNEEAPPLLDYLGDMAWYMDTLVDRRACGTELVGGVHRWIMRANWKIGADNNGGDFYHVNYSHASAFKMRGAPRPNSLEGPGSMQIVAEHGHTMVMQLAATPEERIAGLAVPPLVKDYFLSVLPETVERIGEVRSRVNIQACNVFPNFSFVPGSGTLRIYQPRTPNTLEMWSYCLVDKDAPPEVKKAQVRSYIQSFGPSGMFEQDDGENFTQATMSSTGRLARTLEFNYSMGIGHDRLFHEDLPGLVSRATSEMTQRDFYTRWAEEMGIELENGNGHSGNGHAS